MIRDARYCRLDAHDEFIIYTKRQDGWLFGKNVIVHSLPNQGAFEKFGHTPKTQTYRFQSSGMADVFFETVNLAMDYQDGLRNCLAPINYAKNPGSSVDDVWVNKNPIIGPYQIRKIQGSTARYNKDAELQKLCDIHKRVPLQPKSTHLVLDTMQTTRNGISYVCNLLVKTEDINSGYNPTGLATVEIIGFVSENDADYYSQTSQLHKHIAETENSFSYPEYASVNKKRREMFSTITSKIQENEK